MKSYLLEGPVPYQESLAWKIQQQYFYKQGVQAFLSEDVPFNITSNQVFARQNAEVILASLNEKNSTQTLRILELGGGSGAFAYHFIQAFEEICKAKKWPYFAQLEYWLSDYALSSLKELAQHPALQLYLEQGRLKLIRLDARSPTEAWDLNEKAMQVQQGGFQALIANYQHCCLPIAVLQYKQGQHKILEVQHSLTLSHKTQQAYKLSGIHLSPEKALSPDSLDALLKTDHLQQQDLKVRLFFQEFDPRSLATPIQKALALMLDPMPQASLNLPLSSFASLAAQMPLLKEGGLFLISDQGIASPEAYAEMKVQLPSIYGNSLAHKVNFPLIHLWFQAMGYESHFTANEGYLLQSLLAFRRQPPGTDLKERFYQEFIAENRNIDSQYLLNASAFAMSEGKLELALPYLLRALHYRPQDPEVLYRLAYTYMLKNNLPRARFYADQLHHTYIQTHAHILLSADIHARMGEYALARPLYARVLAQKEGHHLARLNLGLCYFELGELHKAREQIQLVQHRAPENPHLAAIMAHMGLKNL